MSLDATRWAWMQDVARSTDKLVLLSLADRADERHRCYPSIDRLARDTCANRKTVMEAIRRLSEAGLIVATKHHGSGTTYQLIGVSGRHENQSQKRDQYQDRDQYQKRDRTSTKNGTGPVPKTGPEPTKNLSVTNQEKETRDALDLSELPETLSPETWKAYAKARKLMRKPLSQVAVNRLAKQLHKCEQAGYAPDDALGEALERGWTTIKLEWMEKTNAGNQRSGQQGGRTKRVADTLDDIIRNGMEPDADAMGRSTVPQVSGPLRPPLDVGNRGH